jgi:hypothetical protein
MGIIKVIGEVVPEEVKVIGAAGALGAVGIIGVMEAEVLEGIEAKEGRAGEVVNAGEVASAVGAVEVVGIEAATEAAEMTGVGESVDIDYVVVFTRAAGARNSNIARASASVIFVVIQLLGLQ